MTVGPEDTGSSGKENALTRGKRGPGYGLYTWHVSNVSHQNERPRLGHQRQTPRSGLEKSEVMASGPDLSSTRSFGNRL